MVEHLWKDGWRIWFEVNLKNLRCILVSFCRWNCLLAVMPITNILMMWSFLNLNSKERILNDAKIKNGWISICILMYRNLIYQIKWLLIVSWLYIFCIKAFEHISHNFKLLFNTDIFLCYKKAFYCKDLPYDHNTKSYFK